MWRNVDGVLVFNKREPIASLDQVTRNEIDLNMLFPGFTEHG